VAPFNTAGHNANKNGIPNEHNINFNSLFLNYVCIASKSNSVPLLEYTTNNFLKYRMNFF
jgi:hypothetical protein